MKAIGLIEGEKRNKLTKIDEDVYELYIKLKLEA
jgi:hypothetical protein